MEKLPSLVIVGRPNVGKSTLFNRLTGTRRSIVTNEPGITRDRIYGTAEWRGRNLEIVDTGGIVPDDKALIPQEILRQAQVAIRKAALLVLVVDSQAGLTPLDEELARLLRTTGKPFVIAANKVDAVSQENNAAAFHRLGVPVFPIAAEHGTGVDDLLDAALKHGYPGGGSATGTWNAVRGFGGGNLAGAVAADRGEDGNSIGEDGHGKAGDGHGLPCPYGEEEKAPDAVEVAIIGRPNVGKSTLLNRMVGEDRSIVSPIPGTTMDSVDTEVEHEGRLYRFVDTAGIRRKAKTTLVAEKLSVVMARRGLERCDVALLIVDGEQGVTQGDAQIASYAEESGRSVIIVMNKWDLAMKAARKASERDAGTTKGKAKLAARATERPRAGARANARISARTAAQSRVQSKTQARAQSKRGFSIGSDFASRAGASFGGDAGFEANASGTAGIGGSGGAGAKASNGVHAFGDLDKSRLLYDYERMVRDKLKFLSYAPIVFLSAKTGDRAAKLFPLIDQVAAARKKKISTPELNRWLKEDVDLQRGTTPKARPVRIYYMTQAKTAPPTFLIFTNQKTPLHFSYQRFLENQLRAKWDFPGAPIRFVQRLRKPERDTRGPWKHDDDGDGE
jgi:ribosome-associated GTPase EngA